MICQKLEDIASVRYLGATLCKDTTCSAEIHIRIASAMAAMVRLSRIWRCNTISFECKFKLYKSLVASILLYGYETWTLLVDYEKKDPGFKTMCMRKFLRISYLEPKTNDWVQNKVSSCRGSTGTSSGNCQETETCMARACHTPQQPLQNLSLIHI